MTTNTPSSYDYASSYDYVFLFLQCSGQTHGTNFSSSSPVNFAKEMFFSLHLLAERSNKLNLISLDPFIPQCALNYKITVTVTGSNRKFCKENKLQI